jgi:c-di-AMP phosphodiesterase-like protein
MRNLTIFMTLMPFVSFAKDANIESAITVNTFLNTLAIFFILSSAVLVGVIYYLKKKNLITRGATNEEFAESVIKERDFASPRVSMKLLGKSNHPILMLNNKNKILWCNDRAKNILRRGRGDTFNIDIDCEFNKKVSKSYQYSEVIGQNYMIEKSSTHF